MKKFIWKMIISLCSIVVLPMNLVIAMFRGIEKVIFQYLETMYDLWNDNYNWKNNEEEDKD